MLYNSYKDAKEKLKSQTKNRITEKYGNACTEDEIPMEILLGQSERQVVYDRAGRIIKGQVYGLYDKFPLFVFLFMGSISLLIRVCCVYTGGDVAKE